MSYQVIPSPVPLQNPRTGRETKSYIVEDTAGGTQIDFLGKRLFKRIDFARNYARWRVICEETMEKLRERRDQGMEVRGEMQLALF
jgi:hypothetical protein